LSILQPDLVFNLPKELAKGFFYKRSFMMPYTIQVNIDKILPRDLTFMGYFVSYPNTPNDLLAKVREILDKKGQS
jgi:hypothetical protein